MADCGSPAWMISLAMRIVYRIIEYFTSEYATSSATYVSGIYPD